MDSPFYISAMHSGSKCVDKQILYENPQGGETV